MKAEEWVRHKDYKYLSSLILKDAKELVQWNSGELAEAYSHVFGRPELNQANIEFNNAQKGLFKAIQIAHDRYETDFAHRSHASAGQLTFPDTYPDYRSMVTALYKNQLMPVRKAYAKLNPDKAHPVSQTRQMPLPPQKKTAPKPVPKQNSSLMTTLKKGAAIGLTAAIVIGGSALGLGRGKNKSAYDPVKKVAKVQTQEQQDNLDYLIQKKGNVLAFPKNSSNWNVNSQVDIFKLDKDQLQQYTYFMQRCNFCLGILVDGDLWTVGNVHNAKKEGTFDPAMQLRQMDKRLSEEEQKLKQGILSSSPSARSRLFDGDAGEEEHEEYIKRYQILKIVSRQMQDLKKYIMEGRSPEERFERAKALYDKTNERAERAHKLVSNFDGKDAHSLRENLQKQQLKDFGQTAEEGR